jgi:cyclopropane-fatty-acyl-phospholipid synthase
MAHGQIRLVTNLRTAGYVFNPVSFFHCFDPSGAFVCAIADVHNTFGERRPYLLAADSQIATDDGVRAWRQSKELHVSPFFGMDQHYVFRLGELGPATSVRADLFAGERRVLSALQRGERRAFTDRELARIAVRQPLMAQRVMALIHVEAFKLWHKGATVHAKPAFRTSTGSAVRAVEPAKSPAAPGRPAGLPTRTGLRPPPAPPGTAFPVGPVRKLVRWSLSRPIGGSLRVVFPDLTTLSGGEGSGERAATITIHSKDLYRRLAHRRRVAIGESYVAGDWDADNLVDALEILLLTGEALRARAVGRRFTKALEFRPHLARRNPPDPAKRDIQYHYDLGNDFYELFLDRGMNYSCAVFDGTDDLAEAQLVKHRIACRQLQLSADDHLLEIGCGWGGLAITAAREFGARVTGVTLSEGQYREATARVAAAGLQDHISIELRDYRSLEGTFSKIVSIEMFEAIGEAEFETFFRTCDRLLAPEGLVFVQTIAMPDQRYERYRRTTDWIKEYIFPGSLLPSLTAITNAVTASSQLIIHRVQDIGSHYATTLSTWSERFESNLPQVRAMGFDETFIRTWRFYLAACEAAFRTRTIHDYQLLFTRPYNQSLR